MIGQALSYPTLGNPKVFRAKPMKAHPRPERARMMGGRWVDNYLARESRTD